MTLYIHTERGQGSGSGHPDQTLSKLIGNQKETDDGHQEQSR